MLFLLPFKKPVFFPPMRLSNATLDALLSVLAGRKGIPCWHVQILGVRILVFRIPINSVGVTSCLRLIFKDFTELFPKSIGEKMQMLCKFRNNRERHVYSTRSRNNCVLSKNSMRRKRYKPEEIVAKLRQVSGFCPMKV